MVDSDQVDPGIIVKNLKKIWRMGKIYAKIPKITESYRKLPKICAIADKIFPPFILRLSCVYLGVSIDWGDKIFPNRLTLGNSGLGKNQAIAPRKNA
jgi:hypothetical protein